MSDKKTDVTIEVTVRSQAGKAYVAKLRRTGKIPGVINANGKSTLIELDPKLLPKAWRENAKQFNMTTDGKTSRVVIKELQLDPVRRIALHVDLAPVE